MDELVQKISVSFDDIKQIEENDPQYISLKNLYFNIQNKDFYLSLIITNALVCYQLSSQGEEYWEEFHQYFSKKSPQNKTEIISDMILFLKQSKGNKRILNMKIKRLEKVGLFLEKFFWNEKFYYENMQSLQTDLAKSMKQKIHDKTIVFTIKMFWYWARTQFEIFHYFPFEIPIPIDSRLTKLYQIYNKNSNIKIEEFYSLLSQKLWIPPLHLDAILWGWKFNFSKIESSVEN